MTSEKDKDCALHFEEVAKTACIQECIIKMPLAYDSLIGGMGLTLSGGQKQRVLVARALYSKLSKLFVDEGTTHLDKVTELNTLNNLAELEITRIIIAHRSKAIEMASRTIGMLSGTVQEIRNADVNKEKNCVA